MGRSVDDLELACRVVFDASESLASIGEDVIPIPFREVDLPKKLKIGYYYTDGFCRSSPASRRAIDESVKSMENLGHSCVLFEPISRKFLVQGELFNH